MEGSFMTHHMIRVHLQYGEGRHYQHLSQSLQRLGISDRIKQKDGKCFQLPQGEYYVLSPRSPEDIREQVYEIASQISKAAVLVTSGQNVAWVGLEAAG